VPLPKTANAGNVIVDIIKGAGAQRSTNQQLAFCKKANINLKFKNMKFFLPLLQIIIFGLKLTNQIDWNWFCVLSPTLFLIAAIFAILLDKIIVKLIKIDLDL